MSLLDVMALDLRLPAPPAPEPLRLGQRPPAPLHALRNIAFRLERGRVLGIIGESGSGKSLLALSLMGLQPEGAMLTGSLRFGGEDLLSLSARQWSQIRGRYMGMVFQEPMSALNPLHTVGAQVAEPLRWHLGLSRRAARARALDLLSRMGIENAASRMDDYPHQFSGGQRQRITIAMALACEPQLLIADEPTTALDATVQQQILELLHDLVVEREMGLILISHDLGLISQYADDMLVLYAGQVMESGPTTAIFQHMGHPYTRALLAARVPLDAPRHPSGRPYPLFTIAGNVPAMGDLPRGCPFAGRCTFERAECRVYTPPRIPMPSFLPQQAPYSSLGAHWTSCLRPEAMRAGNTQAWR